MTSDNEKQNKMKKMKVNKMMNDMAKKMFLNLQLDKHLSTDITREKKKCKSAINFCIQNHHHQRENNIVDVLRVFFTQIHSDLTCHHYLLLSDDDGHHHPICDKMLFKKRQSNFTNQPKKEKKKIE